MKEIRMWGNDGLILIGGKPEGLGKKSFPVPLLSLQIPHRVAWA